MKTILIVIDQLGVGGAERQLAEILPRLDRKKYQVLIYTLSANGPCAKKLREKGIKVISSSCSKFLLPLSMLKLIRISWKYRPAIIHYYLPKAYLVGSICARFSPKAKLIMSRRSLNVYQNKHPYLARIEKKCHRAMHLILANSKAILNELIHNENVPERKTRLIYNGVRIDQINSPIKNSTPKTLILIIVANLFPYKGHVDLLKAFSIAKNDLPSNWQLLCVGRDEGMLTALKVQSKDSFLDDHVQWLGEREDVSQLLSIADIALLCSHQEGFSNSVLEAMAAKLPLVVTDVGGNSEAVINGETGIVVPSKNPQALSKAIVKLSNDKKLRIDMGEAAYQRANQYFSIQRCVESHHAVYSELLD